MKEYIVKSKMTGKVFGTFNDKFRAAEEFGKMFNGLYNEMFQ